MFCYLMLFRKNDITIVSLLLELIQPLGNAKDQGTDTLLDFCQLKFDHA